MKSNRNSPIPKGHRIEYYFNSTEHVSAVHIWDRVPEERNKGVIVLLHGLGEFGGRHWRIADYLTKNGYTVYAFDHSGFGINFGRKAYITSSAQWVHDMEIYLKLVRKNEKVENKNIHMIGFSLGCTVLTKYLSHTKETFGSVHFLAPAFYLYPQLLKEIVRKLVSTIYRLSPYMYFYSIPTLYLAHSKEVVYEYFRHKCNTPSRASISLIKAIFEVHDQLEILLPTIQPVTIYYGSEDISLGFDSMEMMRSRVERIFKIKNDGSRIIKLNGERHEFIHDNNCYDIFPILFKN